MRALAFCLTVLCAVFLTALGGVVPAPVTAKEYLLTAAKPDRLFVIDMEARKVVREHTIPGPSVAPMTFVPSPDGEVVYIVTEHEKAVTGINIDTGEEVFRARMSWAPDIRTKNYGLDISPDGRELFSYDVATRLHSDRYEILAPRISVFSTTGGLEAEAVRSFEAPRRISMLMMATNGKALYGLGADIYTFDPQTGELVETYPFLHWKRPNLSPPDMLDFWPLWDQTKIFRQLYTVARTNLDPSDPNAFALGLLSIDLNTGKIDVGELAIEPEVLFTIVSSPTANEAFAAFTNMVKIDLETKKAVKKITLDHSYYIVQISGDGSEVYLGGTMCDIPVYAAKDLEKLGEVRLPGCPDMGGAPLRMIQRDELPAR